jgi:DNA-binding response OmpR family regulator
MREAAMVRVLVVDDDAAIGRLLRLTLTSSGIDVHIASSGESALALLQDGYKEPNLILLDLSMPGIDGREVFRLARGAGISCPIVFCSSFGAAAANQELGGHGAIEKPFDPLVVLEMVSTITRSSDG